jgi:alpha-L-rhamnosidase
MKKISRRQFFHHSALGATVISALAESDPLPDNLGISSVNSIQEDLEENVLTTQVTPNFYTAKTLDLAPAQWIWHPAQRTLPNTIFLLRRQIQIDKKVVQAKGWILGDSRYRLFLNGERIQFGPAPSDPRWAEADPIDFTDKLKEGVNVIVAEVLYYGFGDGTWAIGKPGFIFKLDMAFADGSKDTVVSDEYWLSKLANAWKPGQYKRWYLRSFQEEFDANLYRPDWLTERFESYGWFKAAIIAGSRSDKPVISSFARDYLYDSQGSVDGSELRGRSVPPMREEKILVRKLSEQAWLKWKIPADEYFQFLTPEDKSFQVIKEDIARQQADNQWVMSLKTDQAAVLTFEFDEEFVGFPFFTIETDSPNVIVELMIHEAHEIGGKHTLLNTHFNSWSKFTCNVGINYFETFDYESGRWLQLHIRDARGVVKVSDVGMRSRMYPFETPQYFVSDSRYQKLLRASERTFYNSAQETIVDGMARERQQYSGDLGHMMHAIGRVGGAHALGARFCNTWSQGITKEGYFLDCWPAYDRLARLPERQIGLTEWGPIIDHGVGFNFDCWYFYQYTGDRDSLKEVFPRLKRFFKYLQNLKGTDGLLFRSSLRLD